MSITPDEFIRRDPFDDWVPTYTETDDAGMQARFDGFLAQGNDLGLPLTHHPDHRGVDPVRGVRLDNRLSHNSDHYQTQASIVRAFFDAVRSKRTEVVGDMIRQGLVSPDVTNDRGTTPLIAAVDAGNATMVRTLVDLGAEVNAYALWEGTPRTALQVAAAKGNLTIVKVLVETFAANDALIAPDGQLALRLAADAGHRDVVDFLPLRRGGEWRRWQVQHEVAMRRIRSALSAIGSFAKFVFWRLPRFILWWMPKHLVVLPVRDATVWTWQQRRRFGRWCKRQAKALPGRVKRAAQATARGVWRGVKATPKVAKAIGEGIWKGIKAVPKILKAIGRAIWDFLKLIPKAAEKLAKLLWRVVKAIPKVLKIVGLWIWNGLKRMGGAVAGAFMKVFALLHTLVSAVVDFFRGITLRDVWNGFCAVLHAIFVDFPVAVFETVAKLGEVSYDVLKALFGIFGQLLWYIGCGIIWLIIYVPMHVGEILLGMMQSTAKGFKEFLVWINPKM